VDQHASDIRVPTRAILAICCIAQFMVVLDVAIVNVALPQMRDSLGLSVAGQQWVVNAYTLTFAGFLMLGGRAADLFGRRRVFLIGLGIFTLCSLIGGMAQSGSWLITARAAQGIGGAILAPATLSILVTTFTDPGERRRALGAWSATAASGAAVGVLAGGVLTSLLNWRWVLFVNVPIGVVLMVAAWLALPRSEEVGPKKALDIPGAVTVTAGLAVLVYGIVSTNEHPWGSGRTIGTLAVGVALLAVFFVNEAVSVQWDRGHHWLRSVRHVLLPLALPAGRERVLRPPRRSGLLAGWCLHFGGRPDRHAIGAGHGGPAPTDARSRPGRRWTLLARHHRGG
jgi:MFS family permease